MVLTSDLHTSSKLHHYIVITLNTSSLKHFFFRIHNLGFCAHYRTQVLCLVSQTLGKGRKTLGKLLAECSTRRSAHDLSSTGEAGFAECLFSGTRQTFAMCQAALSKKKLKRDGQQQTDERNGRTGRTGRGRKLCRVPDAWHSAKIQTSPSAKLAALGEVSSFAECCQVGTRRCLDICRVPHVQHSAKYQTSPSVKVIILGESFFQKIEKWLLCRVSG
jgi:hypothetical protein